MTAPWLVSKLGAVVNWLWKSGKALPDRSVTPCVTITDIVLDTGRLRPDNVTVRLSDDVLKLKLKRPPFTNNVMLFEFSVLGFIDFEKAITTCPLEPMPVALLA